MLMAGLSLIPKGTVLFHVFWKWTGEVVLKGCCKVFWNSFPANSELVTEDVSSPLRPGGTLPIVTSMEGILP